MTSTLTPDQYRLPLDVKPTHYDITIKTDLEKLTFNGFVNIHLDIKAETSQIVLNASRLELGAASIYSDSLKTFQVQSSQVFDKVSERATFHFANALPAGSKAQLKVVFAGPLTGGMTGYYKSAWEDEGKTKHYALTQFEPTDARAAFPCWDEPLLKATFGVTMVSRADTVNLSNMPAASEGEYDLKLDDQGLFVDAPKETGDWKITRFENTPPMSTYIVAFANGHFKYLESSYTSPLSGKTRPLRIYATSDVIHQAQFALDVKAKVLPIYEQVFDVEFPLPKLDTLVASDFDAGAMENWGLITGRTTALLLDPARADLNAKKQVATTQSHEVAHMWFGNITTMEWWNYLYLNEGFATMMGEVIIADKVFPEWKLDSEFIDDHLNRALSLDAKLSSHPIEVDCPDANHINQIFDALSYSKAASVLRMLSNYVGEDKFLKGVSLYLKEKLYANSVTKDLWEGIGKATGIDVIGIMENWITKIGFPVLTVTETPNGITVRQDRFLETGPAESKDNETIWTIPLSLLSVNEANGKAEVDKSAILDTREKVISLDTGKPFKLNAGTVGVFRVLYTPERLTKIAVEAAREGSSFSFNDRIGLVHDAFALAQAGFAKLSSAFNLVDILRNEQEYLVWSSVATNLSTLKSIWWEHPEIVEHLDAFRAALFVPIVNRLGYEYSASDSPDISSLRTTAITVAANAGDKGVIAELKGRFDHFRKTGDETRIPPDLQRVIFTTAVRYGGREEWEAVKQVHDKPSTPSAKNAAIIAMCASHDPELHRETLDFILTKARDQDCMYFFAGLRANFTTRRLLATFFREHYDRFYKRFENNFTLQGMIKSSLITLTTEGDYQDAVKFFEDKDTAKYAMALQQALDTIRTNKVYLERSSADIQEWLEKWGESNQ